MEDARPAYKVGVKLEIEVADDYGKCACLIPLCFAMLFYAMLCYAILYYAILYKEQLLNSVSWLDLVRLMDMMTRLS